MSAIASGASGIASTIERLSTLQNLVKRDSDAYREEFLLQLQHFQAELEIFKLSPTAPADTFCALVTFLSHVSACYKAEMASFSSDLSSLLSTHGTVLHPAVRRTAAQGLILMRNKGLLEAVPLFTLFFSLFRIKDRSLRELLFNHVVHDIRTINQERKDEATNRAAQGLIYGMMTDSSVAAAHRSLAVMVELYRRHVWQDAKTVNAIASALTSRHPKLVVMALHFFLGIGSNGSSGADGDESDGDNDSDDSDGGGAGLSSVSLDAKKLRTALAAHKHSKHTNRRARQTERMILGLKKNVKKAAAKAGPVFPAIQLVYDPQGIAEKLFARMRGAGERCVHGATSLLVPLSALAHSRASSRLGLYCRFEVRLMMMNLVSRLIGQHRLLLLPFYSFAQRYLKAHQASVTQVLAYLVQACHDLVPPDEVLPVLRSIAANFIADRCGAWRGGGGSARLRV